MKVNFKNSLINNNAHDVRLYKPKQIEADINTKQDYSIKRPAQAISFGGSAVSLGQKFVQNKAVNKLTDFVADNEAAFTAIYSLFLAGIIKPVLVLKSKGSDEKDKQIIATKNFLQAFIGSFINLTIGGGIIKKAVDTIKNDLKLINVEKVNGKTIIKTVSEDSEHAKEVAKSILIRENTGLKSKFQQGIKEFNNRNGVNKAFGFIKSLFKKSDFIPNDEMIKNKAKQVVEEFSKGNKKIFEKNTAFVEKIISEALPELKRNGSTTTLYEAFESFWKNSTGWITAIMKAKVSSLLLPGVMAFLFTKNAMERYSKKNKNNSLEIYSPLLNSQSFKKQNEKYKLALSKTTNNISFKGSLTDGISKSLAKGVEYISMTKTGEKAVNKLAYFKKPSARMADLESILLTVYWLQNTSRSKKIDPDQKLGLNIQTALVTVVSSIMAAVIDKIFDKPMEKIETSFTNVLSANIEKLKEEIKNGKEITNLQETIKESCSNLAGAGTIAKKLASTGLTDDGKIQEVIRDLTKNYGKKIGKLKSLTIFTLVVRLIVPVMMVPIGGKLKNKIKEYQAKKENQKTSKA